jgi:putative transposase
MTAYSTNISNSQWQVISKFLDSKRIRKYDLREIINGILYLVKTGCQWRLLPADFPKWQTTFYYFNTWKKKGIWKQMHDELVLFSRKKAGRKASPSAGIIDSQSVKTTLVSCQSKGYDAGKKIKGIKRHILVDTMGLVLAVIIHSASIQDRGGATSAIASLKQQWKNIKVIFADGGYTGQLIKDIKQQFKITLQIIKRNELHAFKILPKRWIVERTFAWIDVNRRNSKYYERLDDTGTAMVYISSMRVMLNRL